MTVRSAVESAMRSGGTISAREFAPIHEELLNTVDISSIPPDGYLIRSEDAESLRGARFRNGEEERRFYTEFLRLARDRVQVQIMRALRGLSEEGRSATLTCRTGDEAVPCFRRMGGEVALRSPDASFENPLLRFLGGQLNRNAFYGLVGTHLTSDLAAIQLLDGVYYTVEHRDDGYHYLSDGTDVPALPVETQMRVSLLRTLISAEFGASAGAIDEITPM